MKKFFLAFAAVLLISGCTLFQPDQGATPTPSPTGGVYTDPTKPPYDVISTYVIAEKEFRVEFSYSDGQLHYYGSVQTPTPCHNVVIDTTVAESFPEQVTMNVQIKDSGSICTQVIANKTFSGTVQVSEQAKLTVLLEGEPASLQTN